MQKKQVTEIKLQQGGDIKKTHHTAERDEIWKEEKEGVTKTEGSSRRRESEGRRTKNSSSKPYLAVREKKMQKGKLGEMEKWVSAKMEEENGEEWGRER